MIQFISAKTEGTRKFDALMTNCHTISPTGRVLNYQIQGYRAMLLNNGIGVGEYHEVPVKDVSYETPDVDYSPLEERVLAHAGLDEVAAMIQGPHHDFYRGWLSYPKWTPANIKEGRTDTALATVWRATL